MMRISDRLWFVVALVVGVAMGAALLLILTWLLDMIPAILGSG
jgi:hypothetical protein